MDYRSVTETWGLPASPEQLSMAYTRYRLAGDIIQGKKVLELGCGSGMGLPYLKSRGASLVVGGDYTESLLQEARRRVPDIVLIRLDAQRLPFAEAVFDAVLMLEMIYYMRDIDGALAEAKRVLAPGGTVVVVQPNPERVDFNPSPLSTKYLTGSELAQALSRHIGDTQLFGGFPEDADSPVERRLRPLRRLAVRHGLIPRSMRAKALVKRLAYWRLPRLGFVHDGMTSAGGVTELDPALPSARYKTLYAIARRP